MLQHIHEATKLKLKAYPKTGRPKDDKVIFVFAKEGVELARVDGTLEPRAGASCEYDVPVVDDAKASYVLTYWVVADGVDTRNADRFVVWPKKGKLTVQHAEKIDNKDVPMVGFQYFVGQKGKWVLGPPTGTDGTAEFDLQSGEPFKINPATPFEIKTRVKDDARLRDYKAIQNFEAEIKKPVLKPAPGAKPGQKPTKQEFEQFVNLKTADDVEPGLDGKGNLVLIEVGVRVDPTQPTAQSPAREGTPIYIQVKFDGVGGPSKRNKPKPEIMAGLDVSDIALQGAEVAGQPRTYTAIVKLKAGGLPGQFKINLGFAGGDTCEVEIGSTKEFKDAGVKFTNWRKLFYEMAYPDLMEPDLTIVEDPDNPGGERMDLPQGIKDQFIERLNPTFVRYELFKSHKFATNVPLKGLVTSDFLKGGYLTGGVKRTCYIFAKAWEAEAGDPFTSVDKTCIKIRMWDSCYTGDTASNGTKSGIATKDMDKTMDAEVFAGGFGTYYFLPYSGADGTDPYKLAQADGKGWEVKMSGPEKNTYLVDTVLEWETPAQPSTVGASAAKITVEEQYGNPKPAVDLEFEEKTPTLAWDTPDAPNTTGAAPDKLKVEDLNGHGTGSVEVAFETKKATLEWATPSQPEATGAKAGVVRVEELNHGKAGIDLSFAKAQGTGLVATEVASSEVTKIEQLIQSILDDVPAVMVQPQLRFKLIAEWGDPRRVTRFKNVKAAIQNAFDTKSSAGFVSTELKSTEASKLEQFVTALLADPVKLTANEELKLKITGAAGASGCTERFTAVQDTLQQAFVSKSAAGFVSIELRGTEKTKIDTFLSGILKGNVPNLRKQSNKIKMKITGPWGTPGCTERFTAVKNELQTAYTTHKQKVPIHPGIADDGSLLKGDLAKSWVELVTYDSFKVTLGKRASVNDPLLPGDIVGPLSATKAPIRVKWSQVRSTGALNGNSGGGKQAMVLKPNDHNGCSQTICHELGHSMGMTVSENMTSPTWVKVAPPGLKDDAKHVDDGGPYYVTRYDPATEDGGRRSTHTGCHCATGIEAHYANAAGTWGVNTGTCIMWGAGALTRDKFCALCITMLRARNVKDIHSGYTGRSSEEDY